jgi:hypothetical protein
VALILFEYGKRVASRRQSTTAFEKAELGSGISQRVGREGERLLSKRTGQVAELDGRGETGIGGWKEAGLFHAESLRDGLRWGRRVQACR